MYNMEEKLQQIEAVIKEGPFSDTWESLEKYEVPDWYKNAKFGIFLHWGVFTVPAFNNEWYARNMYIEGTEEWKHHRETYGTHDKFGYKDYIPMFTMENYNPDEWAALFKESGAQYVIPVAEHHDGFQMYESELSKWNAKEMGPKRDAFGELTKAVRSIGMNGGASTHRIEHWWFMSNGKKFDSDIKDPVDREDLYWPSMPDPKDLHDIYDETKPTEEYLNDWMIRTCEIIDKYQPSVLYFDWWNQQAVAKKHMRKIMAYYYNRAAKWGKGVVLNYKHDACAFGSAVPDMERGVFSEAKPYYWQTDTAVARNSWCYTTMNDYKSVPELVQYLVDTVSKNGNLLLNIGPKSDGTIPEEDADLLRGIGKWMKVNGEAIYNTVPWKIFGEGPVRASSGMFTDQKALEYTSEDFRYTRKGTTIYAIAMKGSESGIFKMESFKLNRESNYTSFQGVIDHIDVLGVEENVKYVQDLEALTIETKPTDEELPVVIKISVK